MYKIYTDGSCIGNPGPGGWAAIIFDNNGRKMLSGESTYTTNNRMELSAVKEALRKIREAGSVDSKITVYSDSAYVVNAFKEGWLKNWKNNSFFGVKNSDLWIEIDRLASGLDIEFQWVKAHNGDKFNEMCDQIAKSMADSAGKKPKDESPNMDPNSKDAIPARYEELSLFDSMDATSESKDEHNKVIEDPLLQDDVDDLDDIDALVEEVKRLRAENAALKKQNSDLTEVAKTANTMLVDADEYQKAIDLVSFYQDKYRTHVKKSSEFSNAALELIDGYMAKTVFYRKKRICGKHPFCDYCSAYYKSPCPVALVNQKIAENKAKEGVAST